MKDCCKTGDEKPPSNIKKVAKWTVWFILLAIVFTLSIIQIFNL